MTAGTWCSGRMFIERWHLLIVNLFTHKYAVSFVSCHINVVFLCPACWGRGWRVRRGCKLPWHFFQLACWTRDIWCLGKLTDITAAFGDGSNADLWVTAVDSLWRNLTCQSVFWQCSVIQLYSVRGRNRIFVYRLQRTAFWRQVCVCWRSINCTLLCFQVYSVYM